MDNAYNYYGSWLYHVLGNWGGGYRIRRVNRLTFIQISVTGW